MVRWFGHVEKRGDGHITKVIQKIKVPGKMRKGRPELRWLDVLKQGAGEDGGCTG